MQKNDQQFGKPQILYSDTVANIEALTVPEGSLAYATDTNQDGIFNGGVWVWGRGGTGAPYNSADFTGTNWGDLTDGGDTTLHTHGGMYVTGTHNPVTLSAEADTILSLAGQIVGLDTQLPNRIWASSPTGTTTVPTFRTLVDADLPATMAALYTDTEANILATNKTAGQFAYSTDTYKVFVSLGSTVWRELPFLTVAASANPDMGMEQGSSRIGYGTDYITDKRLSNVLIGSNARNENGAIKVDVIKDPDTLEIYLRGIWNTIIYDMTTVNGDFRHTPLNEQIYIWRGDSVSVGINGRPIIQEYQASMGAYPPCRTINGGTF